MKVDDVLIVLLGSGNLENIVVVLNVVKEMGMKSFVVFGFIGGKVFWFVDCVIYNEIYDM